LEWLVTYDVAVETAAGRRRLRRVAKICEAHGQRVQYSVFECRLSEGQFAVLWARLLDVIDSETDNIRAYRMPDARDRLLRVAGKSLPYDIRGMLLV
jgi:CRISPR-associated protein Cas2